MVWCCGVVVVCLCNGDLVVWFVVVLCCGGFVVISMFVVMKVVI